MHTLCTVSPQATAWLTVSVSHSLGRASGEPWSTAPTPTAQRTPQLRRASFNRLEQSRDTARRAQADGRRPRTPALASKPPTRRPGPGARTAQAPHAGIAYGPQRGRNRYVGTPSKFTSCAATPRRAAAQQRTSVQHCWKSSAPTTLETPGPQPQIPSQAHFSAID